MERPDIDCYKDEIHHPNGQIEDRWRHNEYVEDLEKYIEHLESKVNNVVSDDVSNCSSCDRLWNNMEGDNWTCPDCGTKNYYQRHNKERKERSE